MNLAKAVTGEAAHSGRGAGHRPWRFLRVSCLFLRHQRSMDQMRDQTCDDVFIPISATFL